MMRVSLSVMGLDSSHGDKTGYCGRGSPVVRARD